MRLKWKKKSPDKEGFYFVRFPGYSPIVRRVVNRGGEGWRVTVNSAGGVDLSVYRSVLGTEWAGPIELPHD